MFEDITLEEFAYIKDLRVQGDIAFIVIGCLIFLLLFMFIYILILATRKTIVTEKKLMYIRDPSDEMNALREKLKVLEDRERYNERARQQHRFDE